MKIINNITDKLSDELKEKLEPGSKLSIAAACFSVYAFEELKTQLEGIDALRFIFTSPTFLAEQPEKAQREFYIPRLNREKTLYGSEFEIRLRNEFTQKAISRECAEWVRRKASFKSNVTSELMPGFMTVENAVPCAFAPVNGFTRADLGCERGGNMFSMINEIDAPESAAYLTLFDQLWADRRKLKDVTDQVLERITTAYRENSPEFLYFFALYNIFSAFLENISEDDLPNEANGFKESQVWNKLYTFQKDAVLAIISKLEQYNGCILADSVGLGKTFTALAVIKYYENRNLRVLVLCPKKLSDNWMTYKANYVNNPIAGDRLRYDVLYHTDLSRTQGLSGELDLSKINWGAYDLVVIDESHNFRNGGDIDDDGKANRYSDYQINGQICAMRALVAYEEAQYLISEHFIDTFTMGNRRTVVGLRDASRHFEKNILTHAQVERIAASCVGMLEDNRGYLYFGLILLMTTGITISELCALTWGSFSFSKTYAGIIVVEIMAETKLVGDVYRIEELNGPRRRTIPLPPAVAKFYHRVRDNAPNIQENAPFMRSFKNAARRIRPDEFDRWLKGFFKSFGFSKQPELKSLTKNPERTLRATFRSALESCGCDADEIRYLYGSAPESVFARNYCAYDDPRELAKLAAVLDKYAISLTETPCDVSEFKISRKDEDVVMTSTPNCRFSGDVIIDIDGISGHNFEAGSDLLLCIKSNDNIFFTAKLKSKET